MLIPYTPVLILATLAVGLGLLVLGLSFIIGPRKPSPVKSATYESGLVPIGPGRRRVPVRFYLIATLFILFDIEVIYLFPWALHFREMARPVAEGGQGYGSLVAMGVFIGVLLIGYVHVWRKGALEWD
jgi:NADH-quinone oxidoreductase subunit A